MDTIKIILVYFQAFIECFIFWRIMSAVLEVKYSKTVPVAFTVILFFLMVLKQISMNIPSLIKYQVVGLIILLGYSFFCIYFLTKNSIVEKVIWFIVYYFGLMIVELITVLILKLVMDRTIEQITNRDLLSLIFIAIDKVIACLLFELLIRKRKSKILIGITYFKELSIILLFNFILLIGVIFVSYNKRGIVQRIDNVVIIFLFLVFVITAYTVALIFRIEKKSNEEFATKLKLQEIELELKLNNDMVDITDKLRKLRHDMNNHIGIIKALVKTHKYEDLEDYINQIYEDVEIANELVITENKTLSVLLNAKKSLAKQKNIDFTSVISTQEIHMKSKDICSLLGNILDNAIEAADKSGSKKFIQLMIQKTEEGCIINCENSFGVKPIVKKGKFITSKDNSIIHGIGTENIQFIVKKYNGEINFDYDDEIFNIRVVLPV